MGIVGRGALALTKHWEDGPTTWGGTVTHGFPNMFFPGGPHGAAGNNPRYGGDQVEFARDAMVYTRDHGFDSIEVTQEAEDEWSQMVEEFAKYSSFTERSYFYGSNIPGKPRRFLLNPAGRPKLHDFFNGARDHDFAGFALGHASEAANA
jgi:hypothetical protein